MFQKILILVWVLVLETAVGSAVPFITKCTASDSKCIHENAVRATPLFAAGIPELGISTMDPLYFKNIDASTKKLKLLLNDATVTGLKDCNIKRVERDAALSKVYLTAICTIDIKGLYELDGTVLILPLQGEGNIHVKLHKIQMDVIADLNEKTGKDGKIYWNVKSSKYTYALNDKVDLELTNLFGGNELLGQAAREVIATSSKEIILEVGQPIIKSIFDVIINNINNFLHAVPAEDFALD